MNTIEKTKFKTGKVSRIPKDEFEPKNVKVRISMFVDGNACGFHRAAIKSKDHRVKALAC